MFRGGAGLILAHILYWFLHSCTDFFILVLLSFFPAWKKGSSRFISSPECSRTCARAPCPRSTHSHLQPVLSVSELRKERRKALGRAQLRKCHPWTHCTSVTSFRQTITGFSAFWASTPTPSSWCFAATPNPRMQLLKQTSAGGGQAELQWEAELGPQLTLGCLLALASSHHTSVLLPDSSMRNAALPCRLGSTWRSTDGTFDLSYWTWFIFLGLQQQLLLTCLIYLSSVSSHFTGGLWVCLQWQNRHLSDFVRGQGLLALDAFKAQVMHKSIFNDHPKFGFWGFLGVWLVGCFCFVLFFKCVILTFISWLVILPEKWSKFTVYSAIHPHLTFSGNLQKH